jgi:long-chain acyl-CoA synthetase
VTTANDDIARAIDGATVPRNFLATVEQRPDAVALRWTRDGVTTETTYREYADRATRVAAALLELGVGRGSRVVLLMRNRPEFHVADVGVLLTGATPISIYNSSSSEQIQHLVRHCGASVAIVEDGSFLASLLEVRDGLPDLAHVVVVDDAAADAAPGVLPWSSLASAAPVELESAANVAAPDDLVTVIYTSGTTGAPKGVMLDHTNVCWANESLRVALGFPTEGFRVVSYLPMAHIAERLTSHYGGITHGYEITVCPDLHLVLAAFQEARPELLFGVPRTYERIHSGVRAVLAADPDHEAAFDDALAVGAEVAAMRARGEEPRGALADAWERADGEHLRPARALLGLADVKCAVTSAAPMPVEILAFFRSLGLPLSELYGLSESSGPLTWEPRAVRVGTVGRAIPGLELRIGDQGEVLARGGNVFRGYLDDPERTAEAIDGDGWLHTGDVGELDDHGYLRIVDRMKELIITAGGKNVSPANLEAALKAQPLIAQACAIGDGEPYLVALVVLDPEVAPVWAKGRTAGVEPVDPAALASDPVVLAEVAREVADANDRFSHSEQIRRFLVLGEEWLPDSEELTPTMKLKRRGILAKYRDRIAALYRGEIGTEPTP